ncbi:WYL domain-containing protein [Streptomyces sudanensis]|uniref:helix-turn-helix transcriptional regulator n=1 Tax=Streptomyces sudanensis TaxID=436397 RepID=UPI0020CE2C44|nr:WYL domain-containing protein [Streptomyces sudanensis]MCP9985609.1 WYL domain-containing protein [Streptomyces sudanensis]
MNRTDRLYALVEHLRAAAPRFRSARDLAARFEVSVRTIERDIAALQQAGVPVYAQTGRRGGYALDKGASLPPLNFTAEEAVAVALALVPLRRTPFAGQAASALSKLLAAMPDASTAGARDLAGRVKLMGRADVPPAAPTAVWTVIGNAIRRRECVRIDYADAHGRSSTREVEPGLLLTAGEGRHPADWYLAGWCRLREGARAFRLDRVRHAEGTGRHFPPRPAHTLVPQEVRLTLHDLTLE